MFEQNKTPYRGRILVILALIVPSVICTWILYSVIMEYQSKYGQELNWATAKVAGCGIGIVFHFSCWVGGVFSRDFAVVRNRLKELVSDLSISAKLAFTWYLEDIKINGLIYWAYIIIIVANVAVFVDALKTCCSIMGWSF